LAPNASASVEKKKTSKVTKIQRNRRFNIIIFFLDILFDVSKYGEIKNCCFFCGCYDYISS